MPTKQLYNRNLKSVDIGTLISFYLPSDTELKKKQIQQKIEEEKIDQINSIYNFKLKSTLSTMTSNTNAVLNQSSDDLFTTISVVEKNRVQFLLSKQTRLGFQYSLGYEIDQNKSRQQILQNNDEISNINQNTIYFNSKLFAKIDVPFFNDPHQKTQIQLDIQELLLEQKKITQQERKELIVQTLFTLYWQAVAAYSKIQLQQERINLSKNLYEEVKEKASLGSALNFQVLEAENQYIQDQVRLNQMFQSIYDFEENIKDAIKLPDLPYGLFPKSQPKLEKNRLTYEQLEEKVFQHSLQLALLKITQKINLEQQQIYHHQNKANINFSAKYIFNDYDTDLTKSTNHLSNTKTGNYLLSLTWNKTFGKNSFDSQIQQEALKEEQTQLDIDSMQSTLRLEIKKILRTLALNSNLIEIQEKSTNISQTVFERTLASFRLGKSTFNDLTVAQNNLFNAESNLIQAKTNYEIEYYKLLLLKGEIFTYLNL